MCAVVVMAVDIAKVKGKKKKRQILTGGWLWSTRAMVVVDTGGHWPTHCGGDR